MVPASFAVGELAVAPAYPLASPPIVHAMFCETFIPFIGLWCVDACDYVVYLSQDGVITFKYECVRRVLHARGRACPHQEHLRSRARACVCMGGRILGYGADAAVVQTVTMYLHTTFCLIFPELMFATDRFLCSYEEPPAKRRLFRVCGIEVTHQQYHGEIWC